MIDLANSETHSWLAAGVAAVVLYRAVMAGLLEAFHGLPSLQRRRLLEEDGVRDPLLVKLLERPHALGLGISLWSQTLLVLLLTLVWPLRTGLPGGAWTLVALALLYVWVMDLVVPTLVTAGDPGRWVVRLFPFYRWFHRALQPLVDPLARFAERRRELRDRFREPEDEEAIEDGVTALLEEGEAEGILEEEDRELIRNVVGFGDTVVREVMTPRNLIQGIPMDATREEAWNAFRASRHSRMPVFEGTIDQVRGVLLLKDLMQLPSDAPLDMKEVLKPARFVPESKSILELLRDLQRARTQLAVVVDEYGSLSGVVTLEDLLEEVFGEIREEHEQQPEFQELVPGEFLVSGQVHVDDLEHRLDLAWERNGFDTLGGLIMARLGHVPHPLESVEVEGALLTVEKMAGPRILLVRLKLTA